MSPQVVEIKIQVATEHTRKIPSQVNESIMGMQRSKEAWI